MTRMWSIAKWTKHKPILNLRLPKSHAPRPAISIPVGLINYFNTLLVNCTLSKMSNVKYSGPELLEEIK